MRFAKPSSDLDSSIRASETLFRKFRRERQRGPRYFCSRDKLVDRERKMPRHIRHCALKSFIGLLPAEVQFELCSIAIFALVASEARQLAGCYENPRRSSS